MFQIKNILGTPRIIAGLGMTIEPSETIDLLETYTLDDIMKDAYQELIDSVTNDIFRIVDGGELSEPASIDYIDERKSFTESAVSTNEVAQLTHDIAQDSYFEPTINANGFPDGFIIYTDSGKTLKIREWSITYASGVPSAVVVKHYDPDGVTVIETMTYDSFNYTNGFPDNFEGALT